MALLRENNNEEEIIFSPFSLGVILSILHLGAEGNTKKELEKVLFQEKKGIEGAEYYMKVLRSLQAATSNSAKVVRFDELLMNDKFQPSEAFRDQVQESFDAETVQCSFADSQMLVQKINGLCLEKTRGQIKEIVTEKMINSPSLVLVILDVIHFKAPWDEPFSKKEEQKTADFYGVSSTRQEYFMYGLIFASQNFEDPDVKVIGLAYEDYRFNMYFFLPKEGLKLRDWISATSGEAIIALIKEANAPTKCHVQLPRIRVEKTLKAQETLLAMGLRELFTNDAQLSKILSSGGDLHVSKILHKTRMEVNEDGTEAAAVTVALCDHMVTCGVGHESYIPEFFANRPFLYVLTIDQEILFCGTYY